MNFAFCNILQMKCTLSVYHEKLVFDTTKTYFVTNKWDTLNGDEDNVLHEEDNIKPLFESSVKNVWPVPIKKDHFFCISLRRVCRIYFLLISLQRLIITNARISKCSKLIY